jgi:hypothetical protein
MAVVVGVLILIGGIYFLVDNLAPRTYQDSAVSLSYPPNWKPVELSRAAECTHQPEGRRCLVVLVRTPDYTTKIFVIAQDLPTASVLEQEEAYFWSRVSSGTNTILEDRQQVMLDGKPAILRRYSFQSDAGSGHEMSLTMLDGQTLYQVFANAEDGDVLENDMPEIQNILASLVFK